jgi:uncharacterized protein YjbI with pentapeptide repeats
VSADLYHATLIGAKVYQADFAGTLLRYTDHSGVNLQLAKNVSLD